MKLRTWLGLILLATYFAGLTGSVIFLYTDARSFRDMMLYTKGAMDQEQECEESSYKARVILPEEAL